MISLEAISSFYSGKEVLFKRHILREYLQFRILSVVFSSKYADKLCFIGGTAIRIAHGTRRFSEDIDLDNFGLRLDEFGEISDLIVEMFSDEGYSVEIKIVSRNAFRCYFRFPGLLFDLDLSGYESEKILIQLDTEEQFIPYTPDDFLLNKFDVFQRIKIAPPGVLLSQKLWAILNRKTLKGRDFYDATYLFSKTVPDFNYLNEKAGISNTHELRSRLLTRCQSLDTGTLKEDLLPFLVEPREVIRVDAFTDLINAL